MTINRDTTDLTHANPFNQTIVDTCLTIEMSHSTALSRSFYQTYAVRNLASQASFGRANEEMLLEIFSYNLVVARLTPAWHYDILPHQSLRIALVAGFKRNKKVLAV